MARKGAKKSVTLEFEYDAKAGVFRNLRDTRPAKERYEDAPVAEPGLKGGIVPFERAIKRASVREQLGIPPPPTGSGWGSPVWSRWKNHGTASKPDYRYVALPTAVVFGALVVWGLERLSVDVSNWWNSSIFSSGPQRSVASFPTWAASWIVPSGGDVHTLSAQLQSLSTGNPPPPPGSSAPSSSLPGWLLGLLGLAGVKVTNSAGSVTVDVSGMKILGVTTVHLWQAPDGTIAAGSSYADLAAYVLLGYTDLGTSVTVYKWSDGSFRTTSEPPKADVVPVNPDGTCPPGYVLFNVFGTKYCSRIQAS